MKARPLRLVALERQYALALGHYEVAEHASETVIGMKALAEADARITAQKAKLRTKLIRITDSIRSEFDPDWTGSHVRPVFPREKGRKVGEVAKLAYQVLKASGRPLTSREIAKIVAAQLGLMAVEEREMKKLDIAVFNSMTRRKDKQVQAVGAKPVRWAIKPPSESKTPRFSGVSANNPSKLPKPDASRRRERES